MSKKISLDPNLLSLSGPKPSRKSRKKFDKSNKGDKAHNVNYEKILGKLKEMKKNKLQSQATKKKKRENPVNPVNPVNLVNPVNPANPVNPVNMNISSPSLAPTPQENIQVNTEPIILTNDAPIITPSAPVAPPAPVAPVAPPSFAPVPPAPVAPIPAPMIPLLPDPVYGILKNGKKPTRRNYGGGTIIENKKPTRFEKLRTIKRKYQLGKNGKKISVLLKDNKTRKKIKDEIQDLKQTSIKEVRKFLQEKNMIKAGSIAPNNVLRKMYEDMYLTGIVENKSSENLIHNFVNDNENQ